MTIMTITLAALLCGSSTMPGAAPTSNAPHSPPDAQAQRSAPLLREYEWQVLPLPDAVLDLPGAFQLVVTIEGVPLTLQLQRHSLRSESFALIVDHGGGTMVETEPPPVRTYRGVVEGEPESRVSVTLRPEGVTASIRRFAADGAALEPWMIEPAARSSVRVEPDDGLHRDALPGEHLIYRAGAVVTPPMQCDSQESAIDDGAAGAPPPGDPNEGGIAGGTSGLGGYYRARIAFDADYEYYLLNGSNPAAVVTSIEEILGDVDVTYEYDTGICHSIAQIVVRASNGDPYTSSNASERLCELREWWNANKDDVDREIVHLMTGVDLYSASPNGPNYSTIGLAYVDTVRCQPMQVVACSAQSDWAHYGLSEGLGSLAYQVAIVSHELGHNWGACHCNVPSTCPGAGTDDCGIMTASILNPPSTSFAPFSAAQIVETRDQHSGCLVSCGCANQLFVPGIIPSVSQAVSLADCGSEVLLGAGAHQASVLQTQWEKVTIRPLGPPATLVKE